MPQHIQHIRAWRKWRAGSLPLASLFPGKYGLDWNLRNFYRERISRLRLSKEFEKAEAMERNVMRLHELAIKFGVHLTTDNLCVPQ